MGEELADRDSATVDSIEYVEVGTEVSDLAEMTRVICELAASVDAFLHSRPKEPLNACNRSYWYVTKELGIDLRRRPKRTRDPEHPERNRDRIDPVTSSLADLFNFCDEIPFFRHGFEANIRSPCSRLRPSNRMEKGANDSHLLFRRAASPVGLSGVAGSFQRGRLPRGRFPRVTDQDDTPLAVDNFEDRGVPLLPPFVVIWIRRPTKSAGRASSRTGGRAAGGCTKSPPTSTAAAVGSETHNDFMAAHRHAVEYAQTGQRPGRPGPTARERELERTRERFRTRGSGPSR